MGGHTKAHCEESGDRHGRRGPEACSLGIFFLLLHAQRSILVHSGSTNVQTVHISTFGTQQYWITEIAGNNSSNIMRKSGGACAPAGPPKMTPMQKVKHFLTRRMFKVTDGEINVEDRALLSHESVDYNSCH